MDEMGIHPKELHMLLRELEHTTMSSEPSSEEELKEKPKRQKGEKESAP